MRLKQLREGRKLYQKDLAALLGVDRTTYVKYENGSSEPPIDTLIQLADYYSVSLEFLLELPEHNKPIDISPIAMQIARKIDQLTPDNIQFIGKQIDLLLTQQAIEKETFAG